MPAAYPEEFRRRAVLLAVDEGVPAARVAKDLGTWESGLRRWVDCHLVEAGRKPGVTAGERGELVRLRRERRVLRDDVRHGVNGFVHPAGDIEALARAIERLAEDDALRQQYSEASRRIAVEQQGLANEGFIEQVVRFLDSRTA